MLVCKLPQFEKRKIETDVENVYILLSGREMDHFKFPVRAVSR